jgi:hypothetical protein
MLEGIEIIKQTEIIIEQSCGNPIVAIISWVLICLCTLMYLAAIPFVAYNNKRIIAFFSTFSLKIFIPLIIVFIAGIVYRINDIQTKEVPTGKYIYEVTVDDEVSLKEFYEHYEVLDVKDDIFIIQEKE